MKYKIIFSPQAQKHIVEWRKSGQKKILLKIVSLIEELENHPETGTGQPERLKGNLNGYWSRRIDKGNRLVYSIEDSIVSVAVVSLKGHYNDK